MRARLRTLFDAYAAPLGELLGSDGGGSGAAGQAYWAQYSQFGFQQG